MSHPLKNYREEALAAPYEQHGKMRGYGSSPFSPTFSPAPIKKEECSNTLLPSDRHLPLSALVPPGESLLLTLRCMQEKLFKMRDLTFNDDYYTALFLRNIMLLLIVSHVSFSSFPQLHR